jgi:hypothetical protein
MAPTTKMLSKEDGLAFGKIMAQIAESRISEQDRSALSSLLGMQVDDQFFFLKKQLCIKCGKELSFFDVVKTAIDNKTHSIDFFNHLLSGDTFVVRVGSDDKRVSCSSCGTQQPLEIIYACPIYAMWT